MNRRLLRATVFVVALALLAASAVSAGPRIVAELAPLAGGSSNGGGSTDRIDDVSVPDDDSGRGGDLGGSVIIGDYEVVDLGGDDHADEGKGDTQCPGLDPCGP
ncbi:MAG TPA: hypothetical protein VFX65_11995 [Candidatus Limnocylindrales bacterium]|nr:hypothetical protein [Candidatus Limnocylindrales bacterium]